MKNSFYNFWHDTDSTTLPNASIYAKLLLWQQHDFILRTSQQRKKKQLTQINQLINKSLYYVQLI